MRPARDLVDGREQAEGAGEREPRAREPGAAHAQREVQREQRNNFV